MQSLYLPDDYIKMRLGVLPQHGSKKCRERFSDLASMILIFKIPLSPLDIRRVSNIESDNSQNVGSWVGRLQQYF